MSNVHLMLQRAATAISALAAPANHSQCTQHLLRQEAAMDDAIKRSSFNDSRLQIS